MSALSKKQRAALFDMFGGRCAYCGNKLGKRWNADHVLPVGRIYQWERAGGMRTGRFLFTGKMDHPERDRLDNMMPACHHCNIDKSDLKLESWRRRLQDLTGILERNYSAYRHAKRFGLVVEAPLKIVFFFECPRRRIINH